MWITPLASGTVGGTLVGATSTTLMFSQVSSGAYIGATSATCLYSILSAVKVGPTQTTTIFRRSV